MENFEQEVVTTDNGQEVKTMDFGAVIKWLKESKLNSATRLGWNGKGMLISLQTPDENSKMTRPYIYMVCPVGSTKQFGDTEKDELVPWLASQTDLLAEDWLLIN